MRDGTHEGEGRDHEEELQAAAAESEADAREQERIEAEDAADFQRAPRARCHGEAGKPCPRPPVLHTVNLLVPAAVMDFCTPCFWLWVAASLERRGEPDLDLCGTRIRRFVKAGAFDRPAKPPVGAIPFHMVAPDIGFDAGED